MSSPGPFDQKTPCGACPFRRTVTPGALGGSDPTVYIGQVLGPFWLPCHSHMDYTDPVERNDKSKPQCAGAAIFRANSGVAPKLSELKTPDGQTSLHALPADTEAVFATPAEFIAHHCQVPIEHATLALVLCPPQVLVLQELRRVQRKEVSGGS